MIPEELATACQRALSNGQERVSLVVTRKKPHRGERMRLAGRCGPLSDGPVVWNGRGREYFGFWRADEVLAWLVREGLISSASTEEQAK